ncbi:hypothetical protein CWT12_10525 [Actinomyces sp. 432]|nr:hypothetical protein CWT12_10525 [Actinomyces sp. 432]
MWRHRPEHGLKGIGYGGQDRPSVAGGDEVGDGVVIQAAPGQGTGIGQLGRADVLGAERSNPPV